MTPESKIRYIVRELAQDIIEIDTILSHVEMSREEYLQISSTRQFKDALSSAQTEWQGATNTPKRTKLKAAAIAEELLLLVFYAARDSKEESLSSKTKALEVISKIGGLGALEPAVSQGGVMGNIFNLEIHYSNGKSEELSIGAPMVDVTDYSESDIDEEEDQFSNEGFEKISEVFSETTFEEL